MSYDFQNLLTILAQFEITWRKMARLASVLETSVNRNVTFTHIDVSLYQPMHSQLRRTSP